MGQLDHQITAIDEVAYNTPLTTTRAWEFNSESIEDDPRRTEGNPMRTGFTLRSDRGTPWMGGYAGDVEFDVLTKGFGFWLKHMLGNVATTGPAETTVYTHTGTMADLYGKSFTMQTNRPLHPVGTNQPFTYAGGKVTNWEIANSVDSNLVLTMGMDFASCLTATGLATAAYPAGMENFSWAGGTIALGGSSFDVTECSFSCDNNLNVERRFVRANTDKKEPTGGRREVEWSVAADFDSLVQRNRVISTTRAGALAAITATWNGPVLLGSTLFPQVAITIPAGRFDSWGGSVGDDEGIKQEIGGVARFDGTLSPISVVVKSADVTA